MKFTANLGTTTWILKKSYRGMSCDSICRAEGGTCVQSELDALNGGSSELFLSKYSMADYACQDYRVHCEPDNCVGWGSPYVHTGGNAHLCPSPYNPWTCPEPGHFERRECWGGSLPTAAPCRQIPWDCHHTRLCPCEVQGSEPTVTPTNRRGCGRNDPAHKVVAIAQ